MRVVMVMVASLDGIVARRANESVGSWSSAADKLHLQQTLAKCDGIIVGHGTFDEKFVDVPHYVLSRNRSSTPHDEAEQVFYTAMPANQLVTTLAERGHQQILLLGGPTINQLFLEAGVVDELWLTVEPVIFGAGKHLVTAGIEQSLRLVSCEQLNDQGTLLLKYELIK